MIDYERDLMSSDRRRTFFNQRTGEVVPAGTDEVAGRVTKNTDGSYNATTAAGESTRVAKEEGAVLHLINQFRNS